MMFDKMFVDLQIDAEARGAFDALLREMRVATDPEPSLRDEADVLVDLCTAAFDTHNDERTRERRWRLFMQSLAPVAMRTQSPALLQFVRENADLL